VLVVAGGAGRRALLDLRRLHRGIQVAHALELREQLLHVVGGDAVRPAPGRRLLSLERICGRVASQNAAVAEDEPSGDSVTFPQPVHSQMEQEQHSYEAAQYLDL